MLHTPNHNQHADLALTARTETPALTTRAARRHRITIRLAGIIAAATVCLSGASAASADVNLAGVTFRTTAVCSTNADALTVNSTSTASSGSFAMVYLYDYSTGTWMSQNQWYNVSNFGKQWQPFNFGHHARYEVWMRYAQWTSSGWVYSGEYPKPYHERNASGYGTYASNTCYI